MNRLKYDLYALALVFFVFIGNASKAGIDLSLAIIFPMLILIGLSYRFVIAHSVHLTFISLILLLSFAVVRSPLINVSYVDYYYLWPLKAIIIMVLSLRRPVLAWPLFNVLILFLFVLFLVSVGSIQDGRLYSLFGPNMLYRIFGILLISTTVYFFLNIRSSQGVVINSAIVFIIFYSIYALILTGSSGALILLFVGAALVGYFVTSQANLPKLIYLLAICFLSLILFSALSNMHSDLEILSRAAYKIINIESAARIQGWSEIISLPFSLTGYSHSDLNEYWLDGYMYPHNIFVELYAFYGLVGVIISLAILLALYVAAQNVFTGDILAICFVVIFVGSLLSGDLSDNYAVVGLACAILSRPTVAKARNKSAFG